MARLWSPGVHRSISKPPGVSMALSDLLRILTPAAYTSSGLPLPRTTTSVSTAYRNALRSSRRSATRPSRSSKRPLNTTAHSSSWKSTGRRLQSPGSLRKRRSLKLHNKRMHKGRLPAPHQQQTFHAPTKFPPFRSPLLLSQQQYNTGQFNTSAILLLLLRFRL